MVADIAGTFSRAGLLGTLNLAAYLAGVGVVTTVATRVEPTVLLALGLAGTVAGLLTAGLAPSYTVLAAAMIVMGGCSAGVWIPVTAVVSEVVPPRTRGVALGIVVAGFGMSVVASAQLADLARRLGGEGAWRPVWLIEAALGAVVLTAVLAVLRPVRAATRAPGPGRSGSAWSALVQLPGWRAITATYAAYGLGYALYTTYVVSALRRDAGFDAGHAALDYAVLGACSIVGGILVGRVSDHAGRRRTLATCALLQVVCALLVPLHAEPWALLSVAAFGLLMPGTGTVVTAYVGDHTAPRAMGAAFGAVTLAFGAAQVGGPWLGGWLADRTGSFTPTFLISAGAFTVSAAAALSLPRRAGAAATVPTRSVT